MTKIGRERGWPPMSARPVRRLAVAPRRELRRQPAGGDREDPVPARDLRPRALPAPVHGREPRPREDDASDRALRHGGRAGSTRGNSRALTRVSARRAPDRAPRQRTVGRRASRRTFRPTRAMSYGTPRDGRRRAIPDTRAAARHATSTGSSTPTTARPSSPPRSRRNALLEPAELVAEADALAGEVESARARRAANRVAGGPDPRPSRLRRHARRRGTFLRRRGRRVLRRPARERDRRLPIERLTSGSTSSCPAAARPRCALRAVAQRPRRPVRSHGSRLERTHRSVCDRRTQRLLDLPDGEAARRRRGPRRALVGVQLLPRRAPQPGRRQRRRAHDGRPTSSRSPVTRRTRATTPSTP